MKICVWADYWWCEACAVGQYTWKSDDYMTLLVPDDVEDIDEWLEETKPQGRNDIRQPTKEIIMKDLRYSVIEKEGYYIQDVKEKRVICLCSRESDARHIVDVLNEKEK